MATSDVATVNHTFDGLWPVFSGRIQKALDAANASGYPLRAFETLRSAERQDWLYAQGRSRPGRIVTNARGWQSFHQYGVATDVALFDTKTGRWSWDFHPDKIAHFFQDEGLQWLNPFEQCHFQLTGGLPVSEAAALYRTAGMERVWDVIALRIGVKSRP